MNSYTNIVVFVVAIVIIWLVMGFNGLVIRRRRVDEGWADIDVQLKRRHDLIPNLVATVKGYATHETSVFEAVTKARTAAMGAQSSAERGAAENQLSGALKSLFAVVENYPELKASENFGKLQDNLTDTENKIQVARRFYNGLVRDYNTAIETFPTNVIANGFHFEKRDFFEITDATDREAPAVTF